VSTLSGPALIISTDHKKWPRATIAFVALLRHSVSAVPGSAMGGRTSTAVAEQNARDRRAKALAQWDAAKAEPDLLNPAKARC
jgi:hypothetical protein